MGKRTKKQTLTKEETQDVVIPSEDTASEEPQFEHLSYTRGDQFNLEEAWNDRIDYLFNGPKLLPFDHVASYYDVLFDPLDGRKVPKADDGIKDPDQYVSDEMLANYYNTYHISEYVHMATIDREDGSRIKTNQIKFEFGDLLKGYMPSSAHDEESSPVVRLISYAEISKKSFINKINNTLRYINYFIEYFDSDNELMSIYFNLMVQIMNKNSDLTPERFMQSLYASFSTESMIEKVIRMVEYNTNDSLIKKSDRTYDESIQLTVEHLKAIMAVSCIHKFLIPIVSHYYHMKTRLLEKAKMTERDLYYYVFSPFITIFDPYYDIMLYEKLYHTATTRVKKTTNQDSSMWNRRRRLGTTPSSFVNKLMKDFIIDISQKAIFNKSAIIFIHVCFDNSIRNELSQSDHYEFTEMRMDASDSVNETISRFDRWQIDKSFHSQKDRIQSYVSIRDAINRMGMYVGLDFKKARDPAYKNNKKVQKLLEEFHYYQEHIKQPLSNCQMYIIEKYYASIIGSIDDVKMMDASDIIKLIMIIKRDFSARNYIYLKYFISSTLDSTKAKAYTKRKIDAMFQNNPGFQDWIEQYPDIAILKLDKVYEEVKPIIGCPIKVVDYEVEEGQVMVPVDVAVVDELIRLFTSL